MANWGVSYHALRERPRSSGRMAASLLRALPYKSPRIASAFFFFLLRSASRRRVRVSLNPLRVLLPDASHLFISLELLEFPPHPMVNLRRRRKPWRFLDSTIVPPPAIVRARRRHGFGVPTLLV